MPAQDRRDARRSQPGENDMPISQNALAVLIFALPLKAAWAQEQQQPAASEQQAEQDSEPAYSGRPGDQESYEKVLESYAAALGKTRGPYTLLFGEGLPHLESFGVGKGAYQEELGGLALTLADLSLLRHQPVAETISSFFDELGPQPWEQAVYYALIAELGRTMRWRERIRVCQAVLARWPDDIRNPAILFDIVVTQLAQQRDLEAGAVAAMRLCDLAAEESAWRTTFARKKQAVAGAEEICASALYDLAVENHLEGQATGSIDRYNAAIQFYREYLERRPDADNAAEVTWYIADALYLGGRLAGAEGAYAAIAEDETHAHWDGAVFRLMRVRHDILVERYGEIAARPRHARMNIHVARSTEERELALTLAGKRIPIGEDATFSVRPDGSLVERTETSAAGKKLPVYGLTREHRAFVDVCDRLVAAEFTDQAFAEAREENLPALHYLPAQVYYTFGHYEEARRRFLEVIEKYPQDDVAAFSAGLLLNTYLDEGDLAQVEHYSAVFAEKNLGSSELAFTTSRNFSSLEEGAAFKQAFNLIGQGRRADAAAAFLSFHDAYPDSEHAPDSLFNAGNSLELVGDAAAANEVFERYLALYPEDERCEGLHFRIAGNYSGLLDMDRAIATYDALVARYPAGENAAAAASNAAVLRRIAEDHEGAAQAFEAYLEAFPEAPDKQEAALSAAQQWREVGEKEARGFYKRLLKMQPDSDLAIEARYQLAAVYRSQERARKLQRQNDALVELFEALASSGRAGKLAKHRAAELAFRSLVEELAGFLTIAYSGDQEADAQLLLQTKPEQLQQMRDRGTAIMEKYEDFETSSAVLHHLAEAYFAYADIVRAAPVPEGFTELQVTVYREQLQKVTEPIDAKGEALVLSSLEHAQESHAWKTWQERSLKLLKDRFPERYPTAIESLRLEVLDYPAPALSLEPIAIPPDALQDEKEAGAPQGAVPTLDPDSAKYTLVRKADEAYTMLFLGTGELVEQAIAKLRELEEQVPELAAVSFNIGVAYDMLENGVQALAAYRRALQLDPTLTQTRIRISRLVLESEGLEPARAILQEGREQYPDDVQLWLAEIGLLADEGKHEAVREVALQALRAGLQGPEIYACLGLTYQAEGDLRTAGFLFRYAADLAVLTDDPAGRATLLAYLGRILSQQDHDEEAREVLMSAVELDPMNMRALHYLAGFNMAIRDYEQALPLLEQVVSTMPSAAAHLDAGVALVEVGRPLDALSAFQTAQVYAPEQSAPCYNLAVLHGEILDAPDEALVHLAAYETKAGADAAMASGLRARWTAALEAAEGEEPK